MGGILAACLAGGAQTGDRTAALTGLEQEFNTALLHGDWKAVEQIEAEDLIFTNADGSVDGRPQELASIRSGDLKFESIEMSELRVRDLGDVAVTTGKLVERAHYKDADLSGTYRFTDVWSKRKRRWQLVAGQETRCQP
jgi:ketosteroid isomerase-like protein